MGRVRRRGATDVVGELAERLAVLVQAGVTPAAAWRFVADAGDADAAAVAAAHEAGADLPTAIADRGERWESIAAAWQVATVVGAPLSETLRAVAAAVRDAEQCRDEIAVALAEPAATARLMSWLPLVAVGLGMALGFDTLRVLVASPVGVVCGLIGVALMVIARMWTARLVRSAAPSPVVPGMRAELIAVALSGGVSIDRARVLVPGDAVDPDLDALLALSRSAGVPAVRLLRAGAALARHRARTEGRLRAARLGAALLAPLGVCVLPAFLLLGVAPMLMSVLGTTRLEL